jgi:hypothetical protein
MTGHFVVALATEGAAGQTPERETGMIADGVAIERL